MLVSLCRFPVAPDQDVSGRRELTPLVREWCDCGHADFPFGLRFTDSGPDDSQKLIGMQAGAADESAVYAVRG